ncbi:hypothetical protein JOF56_005937 [Kibdelosporangium banguiense]|uniref:VWFA domain-containing protein n=1 Tax=Kibdelosporangium banguiense TaxID=1365924 RepID=A0ABS4TMA5_9PSEU|nr:substrate-binding domain-containing protein [Kibdelosporangium banguiense]MBP2325552.1 hypothetical protein [Kibdelosporangium banguiense]
MYHTIIAVDVEGFGGRDLWHQGVVRTGLYASVQAAFAQCGMRWERCYNEDRGDGVLILVPPEVPNSRLVECLPNELAARLREHNAGADVGARIRLRIVVHVGEVEHDKHGVSAPAVVFAFRLLNSAVLKKALAGSHGVLALITSTEFFENVVVNYPAANPDIYWKARISEKETTTDAWVCLPDNHVVPGAGVRETVRDRSDGARHDKRRVRVGRSSRLVLFMVLLLVGVVGGNVLAAAPPDYDCHEPVQLNLSVSAEKAPVIQKLVPLFERRSWLQDDVHRCKEVSVHVTVVTSADLLIAAIGRGWSGRDDIRDMGPEPHVLLPDSRWEFEAARMALGRNQRTDVTLDNWGSIASSPLVLATSKPREATVSAAAQPHSWQQLLGAARLSPSDQAGAGFRRPSPVSSGTGLLATIALYSAAFGRELTAPALTATGTPPVLYGVERSIAASDAESQTMLCSLRHRMDNPSAAPVDTAVLVSEKAASDFNMGSPLGTTCPPGQRPAGSQLTLSYPTEGTPYLDHPFVVINWNNRPVNERRQIVVRQFFDFLVGPRAQDELRRARFRDRNGDIAPFDGAPPGRPTELPLGVVDVNAVIEAFHDARRSARALLLVDVSTAMSEPFPDVGGTRLTAAADAASRALRSIGDKDDVGLWAFGGHVAGVADYQEVVPMGGSADNLNGTSRGETVRARIRQLRGESRPARLYPVLRESVASIHGGSQSDTRDAVVVIADGTGNEQGITELVDFLLHSGRPVPVFMIAFGTPVCSSVQWQEIVRATGGACHEVGGVADIGTTLDAVAAGLWGGNGG